MSDDRKLAEDVCHASAALWDEITRLRASNAELLDALRDIVGLAETSMRECGEFDIDGELEAARAAIAKATGKGEAS